jgi:hypothetical protein
MVRSDSMIWLTNSAFHAMLYDDIFFLLTLCLAGIQFMSLWSCIQVQSLKIKRLLLQNLHFFFYQNTQTCPKVDSTYTCTVQTYLNPFFPQNKRNLNLKTRAQSETCSSRVISQNHPEAHLLWHLKQCNTQLGFQLPYKAVGTPFVLHTQ